MRTKKTTQFTQRTKTKTSSKIGLKHGFRSGLENLNAEVLLQRGHRVQYEEFTLEYTQPAKLRKYTTDFILENGILVETKGRFLTADRQKHLLIKQMYPDLDLRFVFSNPYQTISKQSKTTYAKWCESKGFLWARETIPEKWCKEPKLKSRIAAAHKAMGWQPGNTDKCN